MEWISIEWRRVVATNPLTCVVNLISTVMCSFSVKYSIAIGMNHVRTHDAGVCDSASWLCRCFWERRTTKFRWIRSAMKFDCMRCVTENVMNAWAYLICFLNKIDNFASNWRLITWEFTEIDLVLLTPCAYASVWQHLFFQKKSSCFVFLLFSVLFTHACLLIAFSKQRFFCRQTSNSTYLLSVLPEITQKHTRMNNEFVDRREFFSCYRRTFCGNLHTIVTLCKYVTHTKKK